MNCYNIVFLNYFISKTAPKGLPKRGQNLHKNMLLSRFCSGPPPDPQNTGKTTLKPVKPHPETGKCTITLRTVAGPARQRK